MEELVAVIKGNISDFNAKMDQVTAKLSGVQKKFQDIGEKATKFITLPVVAAGAASFKMASDYQESLNKVDVAFKSSAEEVEKWSGTTLKAYGIASGTALDMASLYGDMATSMGFNAKQAAKMSMELVGLAGDMASFKNISIDVANTALKSIFTGETESLKTLGIVMTEANIKAWMLSEGIKGNYEKMDQAQKVAIRYNYVLAQTANSQGDFARTGGGAANQMRIMWESLKELAVTFGNVLLPTITNIIKKINEWLESLRNTSPELKKIIVVVAAIAAAIGPLSLALSGILKIVPAIVAAFSVFGSAIIPITAAIAAVTIGIKLFSKENNSGAKAIDAVNSKINEEVFKLKSLFAAIKNASQGTDERNKLIEIANQRYGTYLPNLLTEKSTLLEIEKAQKMATDALIANIAVKESQAQIDALLLERTRKFQELFNEYFSAFGKKYGVDRVPMMMQDLQDAISMAVEFPEGAAKKGYNFYQQWIDGMSKSTGRLKWDFADFQESFLAMVDFGLGQKDPLALLKSYIDSYSKILDLKSSGGGGGDDAVLGLIPKLKKQIEELETKKNSLISENSIKATQKQIDILKSKLDDLTNWRGGELKEIKPKGLGKNALTKDLKVTAEALHDLNKEYVSITDVSENFGGVVEKTFRQATSSIRGVIGELREFSINMNAIFEDLAESTITAFATEIGNVLGGGDFGLDRILTMFADWAIKLGSILIAAGISIDSFKKTILSNPLGVAALGAALVVAGAAVKAAVQTNPTSSAGASSGSGGGNDNWDAYGERNLRGKIEVQVNGVLKGNGRDLYGVITKENARRSL